uniref:AlkB-like protein 3, alpha-ketoglutarate dependent dioxygenase n=1 Tax=Myotis myotis TaxID=51298 RepID=A0A7J7VG41_MYOMY|nr:alkB-like protein 3, alpha-ketoglutarate dependent dioxygenase [Myotis myotis]
MEDKRRRARVQGAWAGSAKSQAVAQPATTPKSHLHQSPGQTWMNKEHHLSDKQFVFKEPQQVVRTAPEPRVIDKEGAYEISQSPTGISRVRLYPAFVDLREADWVLEQLCRDVPWEQRTGIREGREWRLHICGKSEDTLGSRDLANHGRSYTSGLAASGAQRVPL